MIIYKNKHRIDVSPDTYKTMYKRLGYEIESQIKTKSKPKIEIEPKIKAEAETKKVEE